jgi:hypothetical protein
VWCGREHDERVGPGGEELGETRAHGVRAALCDVRPSGKPCPRREPSFRQTAKAAPEPS